MKANFLKLAGVKSEGEFYNKYPTEEAFFKEFPQAKEMAYGGSMMRKKPTEYAKGGYDNPGFKSLPANCLLYTSPSPRD